MDLWCVEQCSAAISARIIHEGFYCNCAYAAPTSRAVVFTRPGGRARPARSQRTVSSMGVNLFQQLVPSPMIRVGQLLRYSTVLLRSAAHGRTVGLAGGVHAYPMAPDAPLH